MGMPKSAKTEFTEEAQFRPINIAFLKGDAKQPFDIFYKTKLFGTDKFVKFASTHPEHHHKVLRLIEQEDTEQEFYIHEEDLFHYYEHVTQSLREMVDDPQVPFEQKSKKIYNVSKDIMQEFFDYNASSKILRSSEAVAEIMEQCLSSVETGFYGIAQITNKDYYTYTHSVNVGLYCMTYAIKVKMNSNDARDLGLGGMLHDVGKSKIDIGILNKNGRLTDEEFEAIKQHTVLGVELLSSMDCYKNNILCMAGEHHEQYNGRGYPEGLAKDEIELFARICKIMDVYDALTTRRSYKKALNPIEALTIMKKEMTPHFDPSLLNSFILLMGPDQ